MIRPPNPIAFLLNWRGDPPAEKLYGAIVARARLPVFYQAVGVPDTLQGRFVVLSLHLFAVLHRLKAQGPEVRPLAQDLIDRFSADMEAVMRELGLGDLAIPKKARGLAAASAALLQDYEQALGGDDAALAAAIAKLLPSAAKPTETASGRLATYLREIVRHLEAQGFADLKSGMLRFPEVRPSAEKSGDRLHDQGR